jgi:hypothetical protein
MIKRFVLFGGMLATSLSLSAQDHTLRTFKKLQLTDQFWAEGAHFADFNRDGAMDVVSGPFWYAGPDFQRRHAYAPATAAFKLQKADGSEEVVPGFEGASGKNNAYSESFFAFTHDFNGDGWPDILNLDTPGKDASWFENPLGQKDGEAPRLWKRHKVFEPVDNESPTFADLTGDGQPELVCNANGYFGYASPDWQNAARPWTFHPITPKTNYHRYTHGLGLGDVNADGRTDLLEMNGWWEQPASLTGDPVWRFHAVPFAPQTGSAQMYAYDFNGDGLNDIFTTLAPHNFGLAWYEQYLENGARKFRRHVILNREPKDNRYGVTFSQAHALELVDMDGDGLKDLVTGKRFWAHGPKGDDEPNAPAVLYWFRLVRGPGNSVDFVPYRIDADSGVGTQVVIGDLNGDRLPDVLVGNKKGLFVHLQQTRPATREEWERAQPKLFPASGISP